jgi:hypothetical protein
MKSGKRRFYAIGIQLYPIPPVPVPIITPYIHGFYGLFGGLWADTIGHPDTISDTLDKAMTDLGKWKAGLSCPCLTAGRTARDKGCWGIALDRSGSLWIALDRSEALRARLNCL